MLTRSLALLCAAAVLVSMFLPWMTTPLGGNLVPWDVIGSLTEEQIREFVETSPATLVFLASFALSAIFLLLALIGRESKSLAFLAGAAPVGLVIWLFVSASEQIDLSGLPISSGDVGEIFTQASRLLGPGALAWIIGASILLLLGLVDPGRRRA